MLYLIRVLGTLCSYPIYVDNIRLGRFLNRKKVLPKLRFWLIKRFSILFSVERNAVFPILKLIESSFEIMSFKVLTVNFENRKCIISL